MRVGAAGRVMWVLMRAVPRQLRARMASHPVRLVAGPACNRHARTQLTHPAMHHAQVGMYVARKVDPVIWSDITVDMPMIIPRGMSGWMPFM